MKLVVVDWVDSSRGQGWAQVEDLDGRVTKCQSVGWIVASDADSVTVGPHIGDDGEQVCGDVTIPRCSILKITPIHDPRKRKTL